MHRPSTPAVLLVIVAALAACIPGQRPPQVAPGHTLQLRETAPATAPAGAFAVAFAAPQGETRDPSEVTVVFNRPMRPLQVAGDGESPSPARLVVRGTDRSPPGGWRWMGTSALMFSPQEALPAATEYVVTVPAGTRSLAGEALGEAFESSFSTARPNPENLELDPDLPPGQLVPGQAFSVRFNQAMDPREVERAGSLMLGDGPSARRLAFHASLPDARSAKRVKLVPASPLPLDTKVTLLFDASLRGTEGPLPMGKPHPFEMSTYGPLQVREVHCWSRRDGVCRPGVSFDVETTNPVPLKELRAHLRISPQLDVAWPKTRGDDDQDSSATVPVTLRAGTTYRVTLTAGMRDLHGQTLGADSVTTLRVGDIDPAVSLGMSGTVMEAAGIAGRAVPVAAVNTPSYALATGALDPRQVADLVTPSPGPYEKAEHRFARVSAWPAVHTQRVTPGAARNVATAKRVPIEPILAATGGRGAFLLATESELHVGNVTDLGLTAKMSRFGSLVWVTRLSDGKVVSGATVTIGDRDGTRFETRTDADGLAVIPADQFAPADDHGSVVETSLVLARLGDDWTWRTMNERTNTAWVDTSGGLGPEGMIFTDRGVYRPGETVELETIFRMPQPRGTLTPAGRTVNVTATDANGDSMIEESAKLDDFGVATLHVKLPDTAHLGQATLVAKLDGDANSGGTSAQVLLAAYKAAEFKVGVDAGAPSWVHGAQGSFDVHGDYLFGAPMAGGRVRWNLTRAPSSFLPPGAGGFVVDDDAYQRDLDSRGPRGGPFQNGVGALDAHGVFAASVPLALDGQRGTEVVTLEAEVQDVTRQTSSARASALVHPASFYVALRRPSDWFLAKGASVRVDAAAVEPSGKRRAGVPVHVDLLRRTWSNALETTGESSGHWHARVVDATVASCDVVTTADTAGCALAPQQPGYYLVRARARDEKGREVTASYELYSIGEGGDAGWAASDASEVALVPDKKNYQVGDVAQVLIKSPFREADALVTVERSGVYRQERVHLVGATPTLRVPITDDLRPNAYVSVHMVRGRTKAAPARGADVGAPAYKAGYTSLQIDPESRRLKVALTPARKDLRPGEVVEADVAVTDASGKPAQGELTMWAVDEGVLMLTGYETPDPLPVFTASRALAVFTLESRGDLARVFRTSWASMGVDKGDEGGGGGPAVRADFRATAWFQPGVKTGADGRAHVRFKLPDNLTTFRLMAVAIGKEDRFGDGQAQVTTSRPLMLRPALPRFLRAGDAMDAGVVVTSKGMADGQVEVTAAVQGLTLGGDPHRVVAVKSGESVEVRWPIAAARAGTAKLSFRARGGGEADAVEVTKHVDAPATMETVALAGETREASAEKLGDLSALRDDVGELSVRVSSTALVGVDDGMSQVLQYPYGCTEQLTSRLVPLVATRDLAVALGIALPEDPDGLADVAVAKILANQRPDGGFGWWPDSRASDPWLTGYALWGLDAARRAGRTVPDEAIEHALGWLRERLSQPSASRVAPAERALVLDVLATLGKPDPGYTNRLYEERAKMPLFARALLAHAIVVGKMDRSQSEELLRDLEQHLRVTPESAMVVDNLGDEYAPLLDSDARTTAIVLRTLVAMDPRHALAPRLARGLLAQRRDGQWSSTHEAAWALLALDDYRRAYEKAPPSFDARVWVSGQLALEAAFQARPPLQREVTVPMATVLGQRDSTLAFQMSGTGTLFYGARLRYARREPPRDEIDRGFYVRKLVRGVTPEGLYPALATLPEQTQTRLRGGDLVLVDLVLVTSSPREQVVLDDPLPAGLEPVDASLSNTASSVQVTEVGGAGDADDAEGSDEDARAAGRGWGSAWYHREMRDDRVLTFVEHMPAGMYQYRYLARATTLGKFVVPPTKAECMYDPAVFGRTPASELVVAAP